MYTSVFITGQTFKSRQGNYRSWCLVLFLRYFLKYPGVTWYVSSETHSHCTFYWTVWRFNGEVGRVVVQETSCLFNVFDRASRSALDLVKHTLICLEALRSDTMLCQHMAGLGVLSSSGSHPQMSVGGSFSFFHAQIPHVKHFILTHCICL